MTENHEQAEKTVKLTDLVPPGWFTKPEESSVWMTGYRVFRVPKEMLASRAKIIDLAQVRAILLFGKLTYQDASQAEIELITETQWKVNADKIQRRETPEGAYVLLLTPFDTDGTKGHEPIARQRITVCVGLLAAFFGRNIVYRRLFDNIVQCVTGQVSTFTPAIENPFWFPAPDIRDMHLTALQRADATISSLSDNDRNRIQLALRWFESAIYDSGVDALLKYWIALETIGMPDTTNIRPLNEALAGAYGISFEEARDRFAIGRLFGLRSRIVHDGLIIAIHGELLKYMEAIYIDILRHHLRLPCEKKAEEITGNPNFDLSSYLPSL